VKLTLKNIKEHPDMSEETNCFSATIYVDGKKAGFVKNEGRGGCNFYTWLDPQVGAAVDAWAKTQDTEFDFEKLDQILDKLLGQEEILRQLRRWSKKQTCFRLKGDKKGAWRNVQAPHSAKVVEFIQGKYGDKVECILDPANLEAGLPFC
jgi:hypothetical protein